MNSESTSHHRAGPAGAHAKASSFAALWAAVRGARRAGSASVGTRLAALPRLIRGVLRGEYPGMAPSKLFLMAAALVYIVSPVDLVPESVFLLLGLGDDALVLTWLAGAVLAETDAFLDWETDRDDIPSSGPTVHSQVV
ncbi:MAG: YkvA family protein [Actinomycetales bacterium]